MSSSKQVYVKNLLKQRYLYIVIFDVGTFNKVRPKIVNVFCMKLQVPKSSYKTSSILLGLVVIRYRERFKNFKKKYEMISQSFKTQHVFSRYHESCAKKSWQFSNFGFQRYTEPLRIHHRLLHFKKKKWNKIK